MNKTNINCEIAILMCTYNSEKFINNQIDSIINQTYKDWKLYIRDDLSTDSTMRIISDYAKEDSRITIINDNEKRGAKHGFMWLLSQVEADYYMFCDHDDVWLSQKVEKSIGLMLSQTDKNTTPIIVCTNAKLTDADLRVRAESYWDDRLYKHSMFSDKYFHLYYNNVLGCTMLFNHKVKEASLPYPQDTAMHDQWVAAATLWKSGRIIPIEEPLMLYRQHGNNTIGAPEQPSLFQQIMNVNKLYKKTVIQFHSSKSLASVPFVVFILLKMKYMLQSHFYRTVNK